MSNNYKNLGCLLEASFAACASDKELLAVTQSEIEGLYTRFRSLDRGHKVCSALLHKHFESSSTRKLLCIML